MVTFTRTRKTLLISLTIVLAISGMLGYVLVQHSHKTSTSESTPDVKPTNTVDYTPANKADSKATEDRKSTDSPSTTLNNGPGKDGSGTKQSSPVSVTITNAFANRDSGSVRIGTLVSGTSTGTCTVTATRVGQSDVTKSAPVAQDVNSYSCGIINIPFTDFPVTGKWKLTLTLKNGESQASNTWPDTVDVPAR